MSAKSLSVDVAVIGGGVIGLSVAWRAAQRGMRVVVLDAGPGRRAAADVAAGMLAPAAEAEHGDAGRDLLRLGLESSARWPAFAAELEAASGISPGLRQSGTLMLARNRDEAEELDRELELRRREGLDVRRLLGAQARRLEPSLAAGVRLAAEAPGDHSLDPRRLLAALAEAALRAGVDLRECTRGAIATTGTGERLRVTGATLDDGSRVRAGVVVAAAGAWSGELGGVPAAARVPVRPVKGQILRLRDPAGPGLVDRVLRHPRGYIVPREDGRYVLGATVEERGFDTSLTAGGVRELLREARELVPGIDELELEESCAGLRPGTPDNLPIVGPAAIEGLVWATGHHRNGILLAPLTADLVADALAGGRFAGDAEASLLRTCAPDRFAGSTPRIARTKAAAGVAA